MFHLSCNLTGVFTDGQVESVGNKRFLALADALYPRSFFPLCSQPQVVIRSIPAHRDKMVFQRWGMFFGYFRLVGRYAGYFSRQQQMSKTVFKRIHAVKPTA
jgi:hypothetical protein